MKMSGLVGFFRRKPMPTYATSQVSSPQEALGILRRKAEVLRAQSANFHSGSTIYADSISRATEVEEAVTQCEQLLECQNYSAVRVLLLRHGVVTPVSLK